ncbi:uncharacterized protein LOC134784459, partial [Penaeus indicus]|uniref:uncharacterized protein LOC134784459 n=1 Tax=Penaeus indicus TaxID=29960 RepID=UPI00300D90D7
MNFVIIFACVAAVAIAAPQYSYVTPDSSEEVEFVPILRDDRVHEEDGTYKFDFEAGNGIRFSQSGSPDGDEDAVIKTGEYSYTAPDGTHIHVRFVADENGFQPQSDALPVAPEGGLLRSSRQFLLFTGNMNFVIIFACVAAVAIAAPQYSYVTPDSSEEVEFVPILRDDRVHEEDGTYKFDFEAGNGIRFSQSGSPDGDEDAVIKTGEYSYTAPDGTHIHVRFVADENGFQPQSDALPVAP